MAEPPLPRPVADGAAADRLRLTTARGLRGLGAGALSVVFAFDLARGGYAAWQVGLALGLAMAAAAAWAVVIPGRLSRLSKRTLLGFGASSIVAGGVLVWYDATDPWTLVPALLLGGIVAGGSDLSPLGALEQGLLASSVEPSGRTRAFVHYNFVGYIGTAIGAGIAGPLSAIRFTATGARDPVWLLYGAVGVALAAVYLWRDSRRAEAERPRLFRPLSEAHRGPILRLSGLLAVDALGGGLVANALVSYYLLTRFGASTDLVGAVLALASVAAGGSLLLALPLARRIGLVPTMVFTHLPSSLLLVLFAFVPTVAIAGAVWVARATISQMDVPTRHSYTQAIVPREEGAAAAGYTTAARSTQALGGPISGALFSAGGPWLAAPFAIAGSVKIVYDLALYRGFRHRRPPEEEA